MSDNNSEQPISQEQLALIDSLRSGAMPRIETIWERDVTHEEFYFLLGRYPYLELCNADQTVPQVKRNPTFSKVNTGWIVYDYGDVMCSSFCDLSIKEIRRLYKTLLGETITPKQKKQDEEGGESGRGTLQRQTFLTAYEMIQRAFSKWDNVGIVDGFYGMKRAAWVAASRFGKEVNGFEPTTEDKVVLYWTNKLTPNVGMEYNPDISPSRG